eukprot:229529-Pyramimonas_sp.AAC.1
MSNMRTIRILEQGRENIIIPGLEMHKVLFGKGARALDLMKTPSGHLALKADEYEMSTEDQGPMSFTITANPQREQAPLLVKEASDPEPIAGTPAVNDDHAYMMPQGTKGIIFSFNGETFPSTIQSLVNNTLKTWHRRNMSFGTTPISADKDFALRSLQAKIYQSIYEEGTKWTPPDARAGTPAEGDAAVQ